MTRQAHPSGPAAEDSARDETALRAVLHQSARAGARRRAVMLHTDRIPAALARPHHLRLARESLAGLAAADRAQVFELSRGRMVIVWRSHGGGELAASRAALDHLLAGQPDGSAPTLGELLTLYDLPEQAPWLLDEVGQASAAPAETPPGRPVDAAQLACLEARLAQADLSRFVRWRPVMHLTDAAPSLAWEERFFAIDEIAEALCPGFCLRADPWLFRRLTRTLDRRMLALLASPHELRGCGFAFARRFAQARGFRIALAGATAAMLRFMDLTAAGLDYVHLTAGEPLERMPQTTLVVLGGIDRAETLDRARRQGVTLGMGMGV